MILFIHLQSLKNLNETPLILLYITKHRNETLVCVTTLIFMFKTKSKDMIIQLRLEYFFL
jgi:hypothetical protein